MGRSNCFRIVCCMFALLSSMFCALPAIAQMSVDVDADVARKAAGVTIVDDLSVKDTALIYAEICIDNNNLYVPGWAIPADLANAKYAASGIMLKITVLPGHKLKGNLIDAAQAQSLAKGVVSASKVLSEEDYKKEVIIYINRFFTGGDFGVESCLSEKNRNPLRIMNLYSLESINGFLRVSDLLHSVSKP